MPATECVRCLLIAGLVYIRLADNAETASPRLATLFFSTMLFLMNPFSYMSFFLADRRFFLLDSANGLYAPSAYHLAAVTASASPLPRSYPAQIPDCEPFSALSVSMARPVLRNCSVHWLRV